MGELRALMDYSNELYSKKLFEVPITLYSDTGETLYKNSEEAIEGIRKENLEKDEEGSIRIWYVDDASVHASFSKVENGEKIHVVIGPKKIKPIKGMKQKIAKESEEVSISMFKNWAGFIYGLCHNDRGTSFIDETQASLDTEEKDEHILQKKMDILMNQKDNKPILLMYIVRFFCALDVENTLLFLDKFYKLLENDYPDNPIQGIKYNIVYLIALISNEVISFSTIDTLRAHSISEVLIADIDEKETKEEIFSYLKQALQRYMGILRDDTKYSPHVKEILQLVNRNIYNDISVAEICNTLYLDPSYLSTLFKKEVGVSMKHHIQSKRIEEAKLLLRYTDVTVSEVAKKLNFCSVGYFTKVFRKFEGVSPKEYCIKNRIHI